MGLGLTVGYYLASNLQTLWLAEYASGRNRSSLGHGGNIGVVPPHDIRPVLLSMIIDALYPLV